MEIKLVWCTQYTRCAASSSRGRSNLLFCVSVWKQRRVPKRFSHFNIRWFPKRILVRGKDQNPEILPLGFSYFYSSNKWKMSRVNCCRPLQNTPPQLLSGMKNMFSPWTFGHSPILSCLGQSIELLESSTASI